MAITLYIFVFFSSNKLYNHHNLHVICFQLIEIFFILTPIYTSLSTSVYLYDSVAVERDQLLPMTHDTGPQITTPAFPVLSPSTYTEHCLPVQPMGNVFIDQVQKKL